MATVYTHTIGTTYKTDSGTVASPVATYTNSAQAGVNTTIAPSTTNHELDIEFLHTEVWSIVLFASGALTIKTNSTTTPGDTITLSAGQALIWAHDYVADNPFTADVTKLYVTNASTTVTSTFKLEALLAAG
jgi:hypothetical protein